LKAHHLQLGLLAALGVAVVYFFWLLPHLLHPTAAAAVASP